MLCTRSVCLRQMARGDWAANMSFWRFVNNPQVTIDKLIEGWSLQTPTAVSGRHVLAIQDTSEIKFHTRRGRRRGLGKVAKGNARGVLLHAMIAVDADSGLCLGLVGGQVRTRKGRVQISQGKQPFANKEMVRSAKDAQARRVVFASARMVHVLHRRGGRFS